VVKFSILLQRDTTWKNLCEQWTNGYGQKIPRRYDYENERIDLRQIRLRDSDTADKCEQKPTRSNTQEERPETHEKSRRMGKLMCQDRSMTIERAQDKQPGPKVKAQEMDNITRIREKLEEEKIETR
jgi:hypothetical protein